MIDFFEYGSKNHNVIFENMFNDFISDPGHEPEVQELIKRYGPVAKWSESLKYKILRDRNDSLKNASPTGDKDPNDSYTIGWRKGTV